MPVVHTVQRSRSLSLDPEPMRPSAAIYRVARADEQAERNRGGRVEADHSTRLMM